MNLVLWFIAVTELEHRLLLCPETNTMEANGLGLLFISGVLATIMIFLSIAPFAYRA
jgi:hypothetical protein